MSEDYCTWDETLEYWETDCGMLWVFTDVGPAENDMRHCPGCGRRVLDATAPADTVPQIVVDSQRERFEAWISPPYERDVRRHSLWPKESLPAWPGQYASISVQLAWEAWCAALGMDATND